MVLGIRIYQDSLRQAAQSVATEEVKLAMPQSIEPRAKAKENVAPAIDLAKKDALIDKLAKRERSAPPLSKNERASDVARDSLKQHSEQDEVRREAEAPVAATGTPALSARALFYGGEPGRADTRSMAKEREQTTKPLAESAPQANRLERPLEGLSQLGKAAGTAAQLRPLGLR